MDFNFGNSTENGRFASVAEQSGIAAGDGGFDIRVRGATELEAAIISSYADAADHILRMGGLSVCDIENEMQFNANKLCF